MRVLRLSETQCADSVHCLRVSVVRGRGLALAGPAARRVSILGVAVTFWVAYFWMFLYVCCFKYVGLLYEFFAQTFSIHFGAFVSR